MKSHPFDKILGKPRVQNGQLVQMARSGTAYRLANVHNAPHGQRATLVRADPKPKGKAARKAAKRLRRERKWL